MPRKGPAPRRPLIARADLTEVLALVLGILGLMAALKVTQVRSGIGTKPKHRGTLRALGLGRIGGRTGPP